jgi:gliding motility-associated-like protein
VNTLLGSGVSVFSAARFRTAFLRLRKKALKMKKVQAATYKFVFGCLLLIAPKAFAQCISTFPYVEDFETSAAWTAGTVPNATVTTCDWTWGAPNHTYVIKSAGSGSKCWNAGGLSGAFYLYDEQGYVVSPCFDFTNLQYPHIKFKLFYETEYHFDGGNLQYSLNGGTTWNDVGICNGTTTNPLPEPNDCNTLNWYNYPGITYLNSPPGFVTSQNGWCGNVQAGGAGWDPSHPTVTCVGGHGPGQWITAEHCLTGCAGQPNVLLRFTFGGGYSCNDFDGFSFDSVAVSNGIPNAATFTATCTGPSSMNFNATPTACPTNTFAWNFGDPSSGASNTSSSQSATHTFSGPGSYTVMLIASGGACNPPDTTRQVVNIMSATVTSFTNVSCGGNNGAAVVSVTSGINPISYTWSPTGGNSATATGLSAGNYTVSVSDGGSCPVTASVTITQGAPIVITLTTTPASCSASNGSAGVSTITGGTSPYTYTWSPSGGNGATASNLSAGIYTLTVTDANLCTGTQSVTVANSSGPQVTVTSTSVTCFGAGNGSATANVTGGAAPITYSWSPVGGTSATASSLAAGTYTIAVSDASGCTVTNVLTISQPTAITTTVASTQATCGQANGTANVSVSGGTGTTYTYNWLPTGGNQASATGLSGGNYTVLITDANSCMDTATVTVPSTANFTVTASSTPVTCYLGSDGSATANVSAGGTYSYVWQPSGGTATATGNVLTAGVYTVLVTDSITGCQIAATTTVTQPPSPVVVVANGTTICNGGSGTISASASGGNGAPFTYVWNTGASGPSVSVNPTSNTVYTVVATDSKGCPSAPDTANVILLPPLAIVVVSNDTVCAGQWAVLSATASGGTGNYTITWQPCNKTGSTIVVQPSSTTTYTATVTDGCTTPSASATGQVIVVPNPVINFNPNPSTGCGPVCVNFAGASTSVAGNNVTTYTWTFGDGGSATGLNATHCYIHSGSYNVCLTGITQRGCRDSIYKPDLITVFPTPEANFGVSPSFTTDIYDNTINFYDQSIGQDINNWQWTLDAGVSSTLQNPVYIYQNEGTYPVTLIVTNSYGCRDTVEKEIVVTPDYTFYAPNAFSPNGDDLNERFLPEGTGWDLNTYNLWVFDRWGNEVFYTSNPDKGWDGTYKQTVVQEDTYVWKVRLNDIFGKQHDYKGQINVVK